MSAETLQVAPTRRQRFGYWSMIVQQAQNAFNERMAQFILIPLGGAVGFAVETSAALMIVLPFVLFAPFAGWLSDRYSKRNVIIGSAFLQLVALIWICAAVWMKSLPFALGGFFALAVQSAVSSRATTGINKALVGSNQPGFAAGVQHMTTMLAVFAGQIVAAWWFDHRYHDLGGSPDVAWSAALPPLLILAALAAPALILSWIIPRVPVRECGVFTLKQSVSHFASLVELWRDAALRRASFGVAFFWGFAAFINLWLVKLAKVVTGGGEGFGSLMSLFMAAASLGMAAGFGFASLLLRRRIELGWVPVAGVAMTMLSAAIFFIPPGGIPVFVALALLAFASAMFFTPLYLWMRVRCPAVNRDELQSAVTLQNCIAAIVAVAVIAGFEHGAKALHVAPMATLRFQMIFVAAACFITTVLTIRLLPAEFIRVVGISLVRLIYRIRMVHPERIPKSGGALMLPNHVTFADAFFISAASPRPVRFVMDEAFVAKRSIRAFTGIFDTMTIRRDQPLEAIREIIRSLKHGDLVCLFPEGQLTRTGTLCVLQRGFELIARKAGHPLIPVWCDGSWGSIFSFERNCFFRKAPHRLERGITFACGDEIPPREANLETVRNGMLTASAEAMAGAFSARSWTSRKPQAVNPASLALWAMDEEARRRMWVNGHQVGSINGLQRRMPFNVLADDPLLTELPGLFAAFPELYHAGLRIREFFDGGESATWVGGDLSRGFIQTSQVTGTIAFYDFGTRCLKPVERAGLGHYPCLAVDGTVVAMSMQHPRESVDSFERQHGHKPRSWGKLLPGWWVSSAPDGTLRAHGPAAPEAGLVLPAGSSLDAEGFLIAR